MKIKLHFGKEEAIKKSGIGRALLHQKQALDLHQIPYLTEKKDLDYDILHINTVWPDSLKMIRQARKNNKKVIYHAHTTEEDFRNSFMFSNLIAPFFRKWLIHLYSKADYILTPTPYSKKILEGYAIDLPIRAVSNGVDLDFFQTTVEQVETFCNTFKINEQDQLIISAGWLFERKGFDTFVEVARELPDYKFIWFGDVKLSYPTRKIRKIMRCLPENVTLAGYVNAKLLRGAYGRSTAFFFPSREETEGIVVLEALSCQAQVVVRDIPVFDDWLKSGVNCYKGKQVDEFVSILTGLATEKKSSTVEAGYEVAKERSLFKIGLQLKEVYEQVLYT